MTPSPTEPAARPEAPALRDPLDAIYERTASALHAVREERDDLRAQLRDAETRERALREAAERAVVAFALLLDLAEERHGTAEPFACRECMVQQAATRWLAALRAALKETER